MKQEDELINVPIDTKLFKELVKKAKKDKRLTKEDVRLLEKERLFPHIWVIEALEELKNEK